MRALMILSASPEMAPLLCSPPFLMASKARNSAKQPHNKTDAGGDAVPAERGQAVARHYIEELPGQHPGDQVRNDKADGDVDALAAAEGAGFLMQLKDCRTHHCRHRQIESQKRCRLALHPPHFAAQDGGAGTRNARNNREDLAATDLKGLAERQLIAFKPARAGRSAFQDQNDDAADDPAGRDEGDCEQEEALNLRRLSSAVAQEADPRGLSHQRGAAGAGPGGSSFARGPRCLRDIGESPRGPNAAGARRSAQWAKRIALRQAPCPRRCCER
jgi:hypothetical protein